VRKSGVLKFSPVWALEPQVAREIAGKAATFCISAASLGLSTFHFYELSVWLCPPLEYFSLAKHQYTSLGSSSISL
jgi:hypothetical protein